MMVKKATKKEIVMSVFVLLWIFIINIVTPMITPWSAWPMFFVTIFFFTLGGDLKQIPSIFLSGIVGIVSAFVLIKLLNALAPLMGVNGAMAILLFAVLALIIVGGNFAPGVFNNTTFAYLTVCGIDMAIIEERFIGWMVMHIIGGAIILGGVMVISIMVEKMFASKYQEGYYEKKVC